MQRLSIVMPAYNEEERLPRTFALLQQAIQENVFSTVILQEILVIDDGSRDRTAEVTEAHRASLQMLRVVRVNPNEGKGNAIHVGLREARGELVLVADADSATPWNQFRRVKEAKAAIVIGSRDLPGSDVRTKQSWIRENMVTKGVVGAIEFGRVE